MSEVYFNFKTFNLHVSGFIWLQKVLIPLMKIIKIIFGFFFFFRCGSSELLIILFTVYILLKEVIVIYILSIFIYLEQRVWSNSSWLFKCQQFIPNPMKLMIFWLSTYRMYSTLTDNSQLKWKKYTILVQGWNTKNTPSLWKMCQKSRLT